ncbi:MAG: hypothetical protein HY514_03230 [Candidatus Aenigmarchaeota archaeon]|nr:hypothetical protein [Candidatus Aenigmarchaeota archaeon]
MFVELVYQIIASVLTMFFLPLPLFWIVLHRNIAHFRRHRTHALYMKAAMLAVAAVFAAFNLRELAAAIETDMMTKTVGAALFALSMYLTYKTTKLMGRDMLIGVAELKNDKRLLTKDLYRSVRHPRYLTVFIFLFGVFLITGILSIFYIFIYSVVMFHFVTVEEERELEKRLGKKYKLYKKRTGRFLPKI